ncbi:MAG: hypothetical protein ACI4KH_03970 [Oscillospiraceae bacterium]
MSNYNKNKLTDEFKNLSYSDRANIANQLHLIEKEDELFENFENTPFLEKLELMGVAFVILLIIKAIFSTFR